MAGTAPRWIIEEDRDQVSEGKELFKGMMGGIKLISVQLMQTYLSACEYPDTGLEMPRWGGEAVGAPPKAGAMLTLNSLGKGRTPGS